MFQIHGDANSEGLMAPLRSYSPPALIWFMIGGKSSLRREGEGNGGINNTISPA